MEFNLFLKFLLVASLGFSACSTLLVFAAVVEPASSGHAGVTFELPEGEGHDLVARACTNCHELGGLDAYKGRTKAIGTVHSGRPWWMIW